MFDKGHLSEEGRRYIRLDSVFPVQFRAFSLDGKTPFSDWLQGFTNNISKGGICLSANNLKPELAESIKEKQAKLSLSIQMPLAAAPVAASAKVAWVEDVSGEPGRYLIGLSYEEIEGSANNRIMRYAEAKRLFIPVIAAIIVILTLGFAAGSYINIKLIKGNKALVEQLVRIVQESSIAKQTVKVINKEKGDLQLKMQALQLRIGSAEEEKAALEKKMAQGKNKNQKTKAALDEKLKGFNAVIEDLTREKIVLDQDLIAVQHKENVIAEDLLRLDKRKASLEKANLENMYQWLRAHQDPQTGLVTSFEGDSDIANWAFIYDQSLVAQAFTNFSDFERVKNILDFFDKKAASQNGLFYNAYYANDGSIAQASASALPNIWLGIAVLQYTNKTRDLRYLNLAEKISAAIINLQNQDGEGGIPAGPAAQRQGVDLNLNAYALFDMEYRVTNEQKYLAARDKILNWLIRHSPSIKRSNEDSAVAAGTYAWSIAAIGPEKLQELGMNPDMILESAEKNTSVEVPYERPEGQTVKIKGFDFAIQRNAPADAVVFSERTAQMVMFFKIMADFYYKKGLIAKARSYELKADDYLQGLNNMIISNPSLSGQGGSYLIYATQEAADTGHDWVRPKGRSIGSLSATAYALFAYYNYNPLKTN